MRKGTNRAREFSDTHCFKRFSESFLLALHLIVEKGEFQSECRRLRVDAVCPADNHGCLEFISTLLQHVEQALKILKNDR